MLAFIETGYDSVVSVPNGAVAKWSMDRSIRKKIINSVPGCKEKQEAAARIIIATDADRQVSKWQKR